jgi:hypothetical protein
MRRPWRPLLSIVVVALLSLSCTNTANQPEWKREPVGNASSDVETARPQKCSRKKVPHEREEVRGVAFARGTGPVFVGLGTAGIVRYREDTAEHHGWYYYKSLWAISPEYQGRVIVTGERLEGSMDLRFNAASGFPGDKLAALEFGESDVAEWRYGPSDTLIRADGCYAFRIEGDAFVEWVTFVAHS